MNAPYQSFADSPAAEKKFPWGCLLGGCLSVLLLVVISISATGYLGYRFYKGQLDAYTSDQPATIPVVEHTPEEVAAINQRIEDFKTSIEQEDEPKPLVLTSDEINALISGEDKLKGRLFVQIEDGEIHGEASFPADILPFGKGRYFNGSVSLKASLENGSLIVQVDNASVNGKPVPEDVMSNLRNQNLAQDAYKDPKSAAFLRKFESLTIEGDKIILTPAKKSARTKPADNKPADNKPTDDARESSPTEEELDSEDSESEPAPVAEITATPGLEPSDKQ